MTFGAAATTGNFNTNFLNNNNFNNNGLGGNFSGNLGFDQSLNQLNLNNAGTINQSLTAQNIERFGGTAGLFTTELLKKIAPLESPYSQAEYSFFDLLASGAESVSSALALTDSKYSTLSGVIGPSIAGITSLFGVFNALNQLSQKEKIQVKSTDSALENYQR